MKQIVVISGKGGTGKTVITASFAALTKNAVFADCDVDATDLHLLLHPIIKEKHEFSGGNKAEINKKKCNECKICTEICRFNAIREIGERVEIDPISCEGCGICTYTCPQQAIQMQKSLNGEWYISDTKYGPLVHAKLGIAEENSGKLVTIVRQNAKTIAEKNQSNYIIIDGPPGTGCPVIASIGGIDIALIVTEPTLSGIHDMQRIIGVANHFRIKSVVCINKYDLNLNNTKTIEEYCQKSDVKVLSKIPFDKTVIETLVKGIPVVECNVAIAEDIKNLWNNLQNELTAFKLMQKED